MSQLNVSVLTLFPEMFPGPLGHSLAGKALEKKEWNLNTVNIRDFSNLNYQKVDDTPLGGGHGLIMRPDIIDKALIHAAAQHKNPKFIYFSPRGTPLTQIKVNEILSRSEEADFPDKPEGRRAGIQDNILGPGTNSLYAHSARVCNAREDRVPIDLILLCGRYEGVDQRVIDHWNMEEISIGDYILSGGELAALVFLDTLVRKIILKNQETLKTESFEVELLEYPQYTVPREFHDLRVPDVLLSGNHGAIEKWRHDQSVKVTKERRPDLWARYLRKQ